MEGVFGEEHEAVLKLSKGHRSLFLNKFLELELLVMALSIEKLLSLCFHVGSCVLHHNLLLGDSVNENARPD